MTATKSEAFESWNSGGGVRFTLKGPFKVGFVSLGDVDKLDTSPGACATCFSAEEIILNRQQQVLLQELEVKVEQTLLTARGGWNLGGGGGLVDLRGVLCWEERRC